MHYYVFYIDSKGDNMYDRTCGSEDKAKEVILKLKKSHPDAFYTVDKLPTEYYY